MHGFWEGGHAEYLKALRLEEEEKIKPLREALEIEADPERNRELKDQIRAIQTEYKEKREAADASLF